MKIYIYQIKAKYILINRIIDQLNLVIKTKFPQIKTLIVLLIRDYPRKVSNWFGIKLTSKLF